MLPSGVGILLNLYPRVDELLGLLENLSGRPSTDAESELKEQLGARIFFLLLGEIETAPNFAAASRRIQSKLQLAPDRALQLTEEITTAASRLRTCKEVKRSGLNDLPYPIRRHILEKQEYRCAVCGWNFRDPDLHGRPLLHAQPTLDHKIPYRIGGDGLTNLRVTCGLCNAVKGEVLHVAERGRVWADNFVFSHNVTVVAFWTMVRDTSCRLPTCGLTPDRVRLFVVRTRSKGPYVIDNCTTRCEMHADPTEVIKY